MSMPLKPHQPHQEQDSQTAYYWRGDTMRSRSVSKLVPSGMVDVPATPARLMADWHRETALHLDLEPGDVEALSLARARVRWPDYSHCIQAASDWTRTWGLRDVLLDSDVALMVCRGARYHHDGDQYGSAAFCNLFLTEDKGLDLHFAVTGHRIPLVRGTVVIFDTGQPHAVIKRGSTCFHAADFPVEQDSTQIFLTWELPIENAQVGQALQIAFDTDPAIALLLDEEQVWLNGARARLCPDSGRYQNAPKV